MAKVFCIIMKGSGFFKQKKRDLKRLEYFQILLGLCTFSIDEFENNFNDIYSDELELKKEDEGPCETLFLDLSIEVHDRKLTTDLFDKRNVFPF